MTNATLENNLNSLLEGKDSTQDSKNTPTPTQTPKPPAQTSRLLAQGLLHMFKRDMALAHVREDDTKDDVIARLVLSGVNIHEEYSSTVEEGDTVIMESVLLYMGNLIGMTDSYTALPDHSNDWDPLQVYAVEAVDQNGSLIKPEDLARLASTHITYRRIVQ